MKWTNVPKWLHDACFFRTKEDGSLEETTAAEADTVMGFKLIGNEWEVRKYSYEHHQEPQTEHAE